MEYNKQLYLNQIVIIVFVVAGDIIKCNTWWWDLTGLVCLSNQIRAYILCNRLQQNSVCYIAMHFFHCISC